MEKSQPLQLWLTISTALVLGVATSHCGGGQLPPCAPGLLNPSLDPPELFQGRVDGTGQIQVGASLTNYQLKVGHFVSEGDIVLGDASRLAKGTGPTASSVISVLQMLWPGGVIPYEIDSSLPTASRVTVAIDHWNANLGGAVKLVPHSNEPDWALFARSSSASTCASSVGMVGGEQEVYIGDDCGTGNVIHEIGHLVGLWHEQNREDRDRYVTIQWQNVESDSQIQFHLTGAWGNDSGSYDYASIMHYPPDAFSTNGQPTIVTVPPGTPFGQRIALSPGDIRGAQALYGAKTSAATAGCAP